MPSSGQNAATAATDSQEQRMPVQTLCRNELVNSQAWGEDGFHPSPLNHVLLKDSERGEVAFRCACTRDPTGLQRVVPIQCSCRWHWLN